MSVMVGAEPDDFDEVSPFSRSWAARLCGGQGSADRQGCEPAIVAEIQCVAESIVCLRAQA